MVKAVYPFNTSTYGLQATNRASLETWPSRAGIRCAICSLSTNNSGTFGTDAPGWTPPVDLYETVDDYVLTAELPGLTREQIDIHAEERRIVIRGARGADPGRAIPCEQLPHRVSAATAASRAPSRCPKSSRSTPSLPISKTAS